MKNNLAIENLYTADSIRTYTGRYVNLRHPDPDTFCIEDMAHSLSIQCRFAAQLPKLYSVAQHCVSGAREFDDPLLSYDFLMHEASETYLLDMPSPVKKMLPAYCALHDKLMRLLARKFNFRYPLLPEIKAQDRQSMEYEWRMYMLDKWGIGKSYCWTSAYAESRFLDCFEKYSPSKK